MRAERSTSPLNRAKSAVHVRFGHLARTMPLRIDGRRHRRRETRCTDERSSSPGLPPWRSRARQRSRAVEGREPTASSWRVRSPARASCASCALRRSAARTSGLSAGTSEGLQDLQAPQAHRARPGRLVKQVLQVRRVMRRAPAARRAGRGPGTTGADGAAGSRGIVVAGCARRIGVHALRRIGRNARRDGRLLERDRAHVHRKRWAAASSPPPPPPPNGRS